MIGIIPAFFPLKQLTENFKQIKPAKYRFRRGM